MAAGDGLLVPSVSSAQYKLVLLSNWLARDLIGTAVPRPYYIDRRERVNENPNFQ